MQLRISPVHATRNRAVGVGGLEESPPVRKACFIKSPCGGLVGQGLFFSAVLLCQLFSIKKQQLM